MMPQWHHRPHETASARRYVKALTLRILVISLLPAIVVGTASLPSVSAGVGQMQHYQNIDDDSTIGNINSTEVSSLQKLIVDLDVTCVFSWLNAPLWLKRNCGEVIHYSQGSAAAVELCLDSAPIARYEKSSHFAKTRFRVELVAEQYGREKRYVDNNPWTSTVATIVTAAGYAKVVEDDAITACAENFLCKKKVKDMDIHAKIEKENTLKAMERENKNKRKYDEYDEDDVSNEAATVLLKVLKSASRSNSRASGSGAVGDGGIETTSGASDAKVLLGQLLEAVQKAAPKDDDSMQLG